MNYPTAPGWYCIGWDREDPQAQADLGPDYGEILQFTGSEWLDKSGEPVESLFCPTLQARVALDAADHYTRQA